MHTCLWLCAQKRFSFFSHPSCSTPTGPPCLYFSPSSLTLHLSSAKCGFSTHFLAFIRTSFCRVLYSNPLPSSHSESLQSDSVIFSWQQQKELLTNSFNQYRTALHQTETKINEQAVCVSTVTSVASLFSETVQNVRLKMCLKQVCKKFKKRQSLICRK